MTDKINGVKLFTQRIIEQKESSDDEDEDDEISKEDVLVDVRNIITDCRLVHILSEQLSELRSKRASTRSEEKRFQYDDMIFKMSEDRGRLHDRISSVERKYL